MQQRERIAVSISAIYQKLRNVEPTTGRALVQYTAVQATRRHRTIA